jgi:hypothetical protein
MYKFIHNEQNCSNIAVPRRRILTSIWLVLGMIGFTDDRSSELRICRISNIACFTETMQAILRVR